MVLGGALGPGFVACDAAAGTWWHPPSFHVALGDIHRRFTWQLWHNLTSTVVLHGRRGTYGTVWRAWAWICRLWRRGTLRGRRGTWWHPPVVHVAAVAQSDIHGRFAWQAWHLWYWVARLGPDLSPVTPRHFAWTSTVVSRGRRGTIWPPRSFCVAGVALMVLGGALGPGFVACDAAALCVAGVGLGDIHLRFTWQAWHNLTSTVVLRGRRGTYGTGWRAWARICRLWRRGTLRGRRGTWWHPPSFHVAGVALGHIYVGFAWQGTISHPPSFCVAGVTPSLTHPLSHTTLSHTIFRTPHPTLSPTIFHAPSFTHHFVTHHLRHTIFHTQLCHTHHLSHTTLSHTIFDTPSFTHHLCNTPSFTHTIFYTQLCQTPSLTHHISHTTLSHTTLSHTIFHTPSFTTPFFTHNFVTHHLWHTIFHTPLCHTPSFTHNFVTRSLSHRTFTHTIFHHTILHTPLCHTPSFTTPSFTHTTLSHTIFRHTIFHTPLCHTPSFTHNFVTRCLSHTHNFHTHTHTIFHTLLCHTHTPSFFVTHHLSHSTLSLTTVLTSRSFTASFPLPSFPVPATTFHAYYWKKLTCGVIRSFNLFVFGPIWPGFSWSNLRVYFCHIGRPFWPHWERKWHCYAKALKLPGCNIK